VAYRPSGIHKTETGRAHVGGRTTWGGVVHRLVALLSGIILIAGLLLNGQKAYGDSSTITVAEDTYVSQGTPNTVHGAYAYLASNAAPGERRLYVKVTVNGIPTQATGVRATLRLWGQTTSNSVFTVWQVPSTWTEGGLTWNNQPALGATVTSRTGATAGQYNDFDVSSYVTGNATFAMAVTTSTTTQINFTSKESTANHPPQLLMSWTPPTTTSSDSTTTATTADTTTTTISDSTTTTSGTTTTTSSSTTTTSTTTTTTPPPPADPVVAAAGDIACAPPATRTSSTCHQQDTANLLAAGGYDAVLPLGDQQYECGELSALQTVYDPTWGRFKSISHPATGDNEYTAGGTGCSTPGAAGHFTYFAGAASPNQPGCTSACPGYYSYDLGTWHVVVLNTECSQPGVGGCGATSAQGKWLAADLAAHPAQCTLAYWHKPYWTDAGGVVTTSSYFVQALYNAGAELILTGHNHYYERFAPQTPSGTVDTATGLRQFIVGTGGKSRHALSATPPPNAEARNNTTYGILKLTLRQGNYAWSFLPEAGKTFTDSGTQSCH
jgi:acid phosphatase type 7